MMCLLVNNFFATKLTFVAKIWCGEFFIYFSNIQEVPDTEHEKQQHVITCSTLTIEILEHVVLVSLLLTLDIFHTLF